MDRNLVGVHPHTPLLPRELLALSHVAQGKTNVQVAKAIGCTVHEAKMHLRRARHRLGVRKTCHAIAIAFAPAGWEPAANVGRARAGREPLLIPRPLPSDRQATEQLIRDAAAVS